MIDRLLRIRRLATLRGDRAALLIVEARIRAILTESEMRVMWGDR